MNDIILLIISMAACISAGIIRKYSGMNFKNKQVMYHIFNLSVSVVSGLTLLVTGKIGDVSPFTVYLGIIFGMLTALNQIFLLKAYDTGPLAYTSVIVTLSTIIPTLSGHFVWGEELSGVQIIGIVLMVSCMICSVDFNKSDNKRSKIPLKWFVCVLVSFLSTGFIGVMQKVHQASPYKNELGGFLILAFMVSALYSLISFLILSQNQLKDKKVFFKEEFKPTVILLMLICGVCVALNNKFNLYLSGVFDSAVFFPVVNGGNLILMAIASVVLFKESLSKLRWFGFMLGIVSVVFLCNPF